MEWTADVALGRWIVDGTSGQLGPSVPDLVPGGFAAYARIFHPLTRSAGDDESPEAAVRWAEAAADFGTAMGPLAQSAVLRRAGDPWSSAATVASSGLVYGPPDQGRLSQLPAVLRLLIRHTSTPEAAVAAIWEGWGGLVSSGGHVSLTLPSRQDARSGCLSALATRLSPRPGTGILRYCPAPNRGKRQSSRPGTGVLPAQVATGPKLELPGRSFFLARTSLQELMADDWEDTVLWAMPPFVHTPSLLWPDDHAWVLATEIDFDSTIIAGSRALVDELTRSDTIEALEVPATADLAWDPRPDAAGVDE
ncbi:MAG: hypothetical protein LBI33_04680 [Propionibacteriaceae bacterium]|jgi:hypothetical protein|nr:hypothetical protein [Propionibacteriaceae bacterium]